MVIKVDGLKAVVILPKRTAKQEREHRLWTYYMMQFRYEGKEVGRGKAA